jgi:bifunctional non-homologous end joining protein LigD
MARGRTQDLLAEYKAKRDFKKTPEPGPERKRSTGNSFVIQKHVARRTHFDFRLEHDGVLKSWAVTKGPSLDPNQKRLAVRTEDHPLEYGGFEGVIPKGEYGAGPVMIWDRGTWEPIGDPDAGLAKGDLKFRLHGERLKGDWVLVRMKGRTNDGKRENWLLIKKRDDYAHDGDEPTQTYDTSVVSGRDMPGIEAGDVAVWNSNHSKKKPASSLPGRGDSTPKTQRTLTPEFVAPELATLESEVPDDDGWLHEVKYDGYRIIGRKAGDAVTLFSRSGLDWTVRFPAIANALAKLPCKDALVDGEVAFVLPSGVTDFKSLQEHIDTTHQAVRYFLFDLIELNGEDWLKKTLETRKAQLARLLSAKGLPERLIYSDHVQGSGRAFLAEACASGLEGIVSKRASAPYRSGRSKDWLKIKCGKRAEFVIGGYSRSTAKDRPFASLLFGTFKDGALNYAGKVGTGFDGADLAALAKRFEPLERKTSPFAEVPTAGRRGTVWLEPELVAEIAYSEWTRDGRLRHPSFQGLREDKPAREVHRDEPEAKDHAVVAESGGHASKRKRDPMFAGITLSNPNKVLFPDPGLTKLDLAHYYEVVAPAMLPYIVNRPISLVRCPEGYAKECFFQRHGMKGMSTAIKEIHIAGGESKRKYLYIEDAEGLFALVQIGALEIHDWSVSLGEIDKPDRLVFDLDPDEGLDLATLKAAAQEVREFLADLGLKSFLKSTGGKGLHTLAPLTPKLGWAEIKAFAKGVADGLVAARPDRYTANPLKRTRKDKIFIDYLRNQRGGSAIANFSTRARGGAPVAVPLAWGELKALKMAAPYDVNTMPQRLTRLRQDPWEGFFTTRQSINAKALKALGLA